VLFYFYLMVVCDVAAEIFRYKDWLVTNLGSKHAGKILVIGCFFSLMLAHMAHAVVCGLFLRYAQLWSIITEELYFSAASIRTLGYGDILLQ
jgi:hypothetical protein